MVFSATIAINFTLQKKHMKNKSVVALKRLAFYTNLTIKALFLSKIAIGFGGTCHLLPILILKLQPDVIFFSTKKMDVISYCIVFAFDPKVNIDRITVYRSFQQNFEELFDLSHLKKQMFQHIDQVTLNQLKDAGLKVHEKKSSFALSEVFLTF